MKRFSLPCIAAVLSLMLTASAFAGDIYIGKAPPPPPGSASASVTAPGDIYIDRTDIASAPSDSASHIALNLLLSILSVF